MRMRGGDIAAVRIVYVVYLELGGKVSFRDRWPYILVCIHEIAYSILCTDVG